MIEEYRKHAGQPRIGRCKELIELLAKLNRIGERDRHLKEIPVPRVHKRRVADADQHMLVRTLRRSSEIADTTDHLCHSVFSKIALIASGRVRPSSAASSFANNSGGNRTSTPSLPRFLSRRFWAGCDITALSSGMVGFERDITLGFGDIIAAGLACGTTAAG
ncbi:MAG: hypothetical protein Q8P46_00310 [Hyphomicrobiales bacterium]|nr:hypothetical protein [Hyphomicrobiales bacterium]